MSDETYTWDEIRKALELANIKTDPGPYEIEMNVGYFLICLKKVKRGEE